MLQFAAILTKKWSCLRHCVTIQPLRTLPVTNAYELWNRRQNRSAGCTAKRPRLAEFTEYLEFVYRSLPIAVVAVSRRTSAVATAGNRRARAARVPAAALHGKGWRARTSDRPTERAGGRAGGWRAATFIAGRSVGAGLRLLIATPDCKSTRRAAERWMPVPARWSPGLAHRASWAVSLPSTTSRHQRMFVFVVQGEHSAAFEQKVTGGNTFTLVKFHDR